MSSQNEPKIAGSAILDQHKILVSLCGPAAVARAVASLPEDVRREYEGLSPLSWCRTTTDRAVVEACAAELGRDPARFHMEVVRQSLEHTLKTIWRVFLRLTSDEALIKRAATMYAKTYDTGSIEAEIENGTARVIHHGWPGMSEYDFRNLGIGMETVLRCAGRKSVRARWTGRPPTICYTFTWQR